MQDIFESLRPCLSLYAVVCVAGVTGKNNLVMMFLGHQPLGHVLIGHHPIVHPVVHDVQIEKIPFSQFHPDSQRFGRAVGIKALMKIPGAVLATIRCMPAKRTISSAKQ